MMRGQLYIDGKDAYKEYGVYVVSGGHNEVIAYAPLKSVSTNDWQEEDGIEADLSEPQLDTKECTVKFAFCGRDIRLDNFIASLSDGSYHTLNFVSILRSYRLRMVSCTSLSLAYRLGFVNVKFANDFPLDGYSYEEPCSTVVETYGDYLLDGRPLTDYGVRVLQGTLAEVKKPAAVKPNLLRNIKTRPGAIYDGKRVTFKSKDVKIFCLMRAATLSELWRNYDALLCDLVRPEERELFVSHTNARYPCYYKSCAVSKFFPDGKIWLEFTLTLCFTKFRNNRIHELRKVFENSLRLTGNGKFRLTI